MLAAFHCILKSNLQYTLYLRTSIHIRIIGFVIILIFFTKIHTSCQFTNTKEISSFYQFRTKRRLMNQAFKSLHRTDIGKKSQLLTHSQQSLLRTNFCCRIIIKLRITYSRKKYSVCFLTYTVSFFRKGIPHFIDRICTTNGVFIIYFMSKLLANGTHYLYPLYGNFGSDTVTC